MFYATIYLLIYWLQKLIYFNVIGSHNPAPEVNLFDAFFLSWQGLSTRGTGLALVAVDSSQCVWLSPCECACVCVHSEMQWNAVIHGPVVRSDY